MQNIIEKTGKRNDDLRRCLAFAGVVAPIMFWVISIGLAVIQPGYSPVKHTLSALVWWPHGWLQTLDFCLFGLLVMLFTAGLYVGFKQIGSLRVGLAMMFLIGCGILTIGIFPTDVGIASTLHGTIHGLTFRTLSLLYPLVCFLMLPSLKSDPRWKGMAGYTALAGILMLALVMAGLVLHITGRLDSWAGLYERIITANAIIWLEAMALRLLFLPSSISRTEDEIGMALVRGLSGEFWVHLGESGRLIFNRTRAKPKAKQPGTGLGQVSGYVAFGVLLAAATTAHYQERKARRQGQMLQHQNEVETALLWGAKKLGSRLGLAPIAELMESLVEGKTVLISPEFQMVNPAAAHLDKPSGNNKSGILLQ